MSKSGSSLLARTAATNNLAESLGLGSQWQPMNQASYELIEAWRPLTSKIIFEGIDDFKSSCYLVESKRSHGKKRSRKDRLWEFPGGHVDRGETAVSALMRELDEEDPSGILLNEFKIALKSENAGLRYSNIKLKNGDHHTLFKTGLQEKSYQLLQSYWESSAKPNSEVYHFVWAKLKHLDKNQSNLAAHWTPKARKILKSLRARKNL